MAAKTIEIGRWNITFVFRHKWEKFDEVIEIFRHKMDRREWKLGLWFKQSKILGKKGFTKHNHHLVNSYMVGIDLLVCEAWIDWNKDGLEIKI